MENLDFLQKRSRWPLEPTDCKYLNQRWQLDPSNSEMLVCLLKTSCWQNYGKLTVADGLFEKEKLFKIFNSFVFAIIWFLQKVWTRRRWGTTSVIMSNTFKSAIQSVRTTNTSFPVFFTVHTDNFEHLISEKF